MIPLVLSTSSVIQEEELIGLDCSLGMARILLGTAASKLLSEIQFGARLISGNSSFRRRNGLHRIDIALGIGDRIAQIAV